MNLVIIKKKIKRYSVGFALLCRIRNKTKFRFQILPTPRKVSVAFSNNFPSRLKKNLILCYHFNNLQMFSNLNSSYYYREGKKMSCGSKLGFVRSPDLYIRI